MSTRITLQGAGGFTCLSGTTTTDGKTYRYYTLYGNNNASTKTGSITFPKTLYFYFMLVGGGGAGGTNGDSGGGGGGGGGIFYNYQTTHTALSTSDITFKVGGGGTGTNNGGETYLYFRHSTGSVKSIQTPGGNTGATTLGGSSVSTDSIDQTSGSNNVVIESGAGRDTGSQAQGGNGLNVTNTSGSVRAVLNVLSVNYIASGGFCGRTTFGGIGGSSETGGGNGVTSGSSNSTQIGGGGGGGTTSTAPKGGDGLVAIWFEVLNSSITISTSSSSVVAFAVFTITVTFTTPSVNVAGNGSFKLFDDETQTTYLSGNLPIPTSNIISCSSIGGKTLQCSFESNYPEYFTNSESNIKVIMITPATQSAFTFSTAVSVYGSTVNLSSLVTGGTSGGSYSFTVNESSINGTAYIFPSAASYSVIATKTVTNYYDLPLQQTITITPATQPDLSFSLAAASYTSVYRPSPNNTFDLSLSGFVTGGVAGAVLSFSGTNVEGTTLSYTSAASYTVFATKKLSNYNDISLSKVITITPATQSAFTFSAPPNSALFYNPSNKIVDLLACYTGGTSGGSYSFTVSGVAISGTNLNYTSPGTYTVIATKTVDNYNPLIDIARTITIIYATLDEINNVQINFNILTSTTAEITGGGSNISPHTDFSMIIPSTVLNVYSVVSIGRNAFIDDVPNSNYHLKNVTLPSTVTNIGQSAFEYNNKMKQINLEYIETFGKNAFISCQQMHTNGIITLSGRTKTIGDSALANINCSSIVIRNDGYNNNLTIDHAAFFSNANLTSLVIHPRPVITFGVGGWICHNCPILTSIVFPNGVTNISNKFANDCPNVQKVYLYCTDIPTYGDTPFPISNPTFYYLEGATSLANFPLSITKQVLLKLVSYTLYRQSNSKIIFRVVFQNSQTVFNSAHFTFDNGSLGTMTSSDDGNKTWNGIFNSVSNSSILTITPNKYAVEDLIFGWAVSPTTPLTMNQMFQPTQSTFTFSAPSIVYNPLNPIVDLLALVSGGTSGGSYSFTVDGLATAGSTLNYTSARTYAVLATKTVENYADKEYAREITITPATQENFTFSAPSIVYNPLNPTVDLLALVSGGTSGGSYSFTVDGLATTGSTLNYTSARTYAVLATKTVENYYSLQISQTITITNATQPLFYFIGPFPSPILAEPENNIVDLSLILSGKTEGGHELATTSYSGFGVSGPIAGNWILTYTYAGNYTVYATKKYPNYNDTTASTVVTIYNRVYTKTELLNGPTSTFYFLWTEHANYNNPTFGYTLTISNEYTKYERAIPSLGETIRPYISTNRSSIVDLSGISSTTTITFTSMAAISNVVVYPVAKIIDNFNNSAIDISLSNHFNETHNSYTYTSSIFNQNEVPLPDISFSNITGYSFSFKPMRISQYNTYYRILQENIFNGDDVVQASDLTPDTSYTILTNISYPQSSRFLYPSFQNYEKTFYISTRNESRIASLDITNIRAESIVMRISDVSNSSDISRVDISVMTTTNNNLIQFISLSNGQFPYTLSGLPMDTSFNIVTNHVYFGTGNTYDSSGLSFSTKKQSKVARIPGIVNDLVHRIDETGDHMNLFIKFGSSVGDPSYNTLYFKRLSDTFYTTYTIPQNVFEFDFSGTLTLPFEKNQRYSIYIRTTYNDGNFYDTATFDFSAIQQSVLNNNYLLDFSDSITSYSNGVYYTNPYFYTLTDGFMAYDMPRSSTNTIIRQPNNNEHGPVAILYHTSYPNPFSRLAQTISVNLDVKIYSFSFWYANVFEKSSRPYYNALGTNKTENTVMFAVYLEDVASNSAIQNTRFLTSSSDTSWTRFDVSFSLNMKRNISTVNLVIERTEYEYNMLALMNIQFQQEPENNIDYSVGLLRNVFGEESLLYNISVFIYGSQAYDTFTTATEYSVTIKYDNTNAYSFINTLFISNVLSSATVSSFNISGNTFIINSQSGFAIYPNQTYEMYVKTEIQSKSFYSQPVVFNAIPYQSPARIIYNISFGYYTLVDHYSRMHQTNLFAPYLDEDMYAVHLCFAPPFGDTNTFINTLHITNLSDSKSIEVNIPSSNSLFTFKGVDHTDISGLYLDTSYQIYISTLYTRSGNSFDTASFVFRIPDVSYTLVDY